MNLTLWTLWVCAVAEVMYVAEVCRHGARAPVQSFPWSEGRWKPEDLGNLTPKGKKQHIEVGRRLAEQYKGLLSEQFDPLQIKVVTTDTLRTKESSLNQLIGIFPTMKYAFATDVLPYLYDSAMCYPLSFSVLKNGQNAMLQGYRKENCSRIKYSVIKITKSHYFKSREQQLLQEISDIVSLIGRNITTYKMLSTLVSDLKCDIEEGLEIPKQVLAKLPILMKHELYYRVSVPFSDEESMTLFSSVFFSQLLTEMNGALSGQPLRFSLFSAHEMTVGGLLLALGMNLVEIPDFAATLVFELHSDGRVEVKYQGEKLKLQFCPEPCYFSTFQEQLQSRITPDIVSSCGLEGWEEILAPVQYS